VHPPRSPGRCQENSVLREIQGITDRRIGETPINRNRDLAFETRIGNFYNESSKFQKLLSCRAEGKLHLLSARRSRYQFSGQPGATDAPRQSQDEVITSGLLAAPVRHPADLRLLLHPHPTLLFFTHASVIEN